jgi:hypothetical protein
MKLNGIFNQTLCTSTFLEILMKQTRGTYVAYNSCHIFTRHTLINNSLFVYRNLRLFFSLLLMDTQLPSNCHLVAEIKSEAVTYGLYEAFLESAPQLILQLSIVLRSGFISKTFYKILFFSNLLLNFIEI